MNDVLPFINIGVIALQAPLLVYFFKHVWDKVQREDMRQNQMDVILETHNQKLESIKEKLAAQNVEITKIEERLDELLLVTSKFNMERKRLNGGGS